ncbi:MAG: hypothetical protein FWG79_09820, partial [Bacteroidales bacterium]|nr:hypothetical protein [Bacteroidales bacterium]
YVYDESGQLLEETNSLSKTRRFEYEGRLPVRKIDRNGRVIEFEYNDFGRPVAEKWLDGAKTVKTFLYTYDRANNMVLVDDGLTKIEYDFDVVDRKTKSQMKIEGMNQPVSFMTTYNELGLKSRVAVSLCDYVNDYAYNKNKQMISITQGDKHIEYSYNAAGLRKSIAASAGGKKAYETLYEYTGKSRLKSLTHRNGEKVYANYNYSWDVADRITSVNDANFGYDKTSQLTLVEHDELPKELYEYDANGNRKNYKTGKNNRLLSDGEFDYEYDAEGNRVAKKSKSGETTKYEWDHRNRLVKVVTPQETVEYAYDYQNQLIKRNDEFFIHDGWQIAFTCDRTGKVTNTYLWGAKQDELLCEGNNWTLCDYLGTIRKVIDSDGVLLNNFEYSAFGDLAKVADEGKRTRFRYTGKLFDDVSQLQWNIYRWYDAKVGQWLSVDPLGLGFVNHNLYKYSNNNPIVEIDSFGLLSNGDASYVLYCLFAKHPNKCGEKGSIITYLGNGMLIDAATSMSIDLMFAGITLPASLVGKVSVATLTQIAHMLLENAINGTEINYNTIVQALINVLGAAAEDVSILVPLVQHILGELAGYSASECTTIFSEYTTTPNNIGVQVNIACVFNVCAKKVWASLMFVITNWSASGACSYTCTDGQAHHKCCNLGLKNSGTVSISGSGHGAGYYPCTVNNAG